MSPAPAGHRDMRPRTTLRAYLRRMAKQKRLMDGNSKKKRLGIFFQRFEKNKKQTPNNLFGSSSVKNIPTMKIHPYILFYCIFTQTGGRSALRPL